MPASIWLIGAACVAYVCTDAGTALLQRALTGRLMDVPNARSSHSTPTPRGGGLAIVAVVLLGTAVVAAMFGFTNTIAIPLLGGAVIAAISLLDDIRTLPASLRLTVHTLTAIVVVGLLTDWTGIPFASLSAAVTFPLAVLWVVGLTNAYNFMDGIDGIAGAQGVVAGAGWAALGWLLGVPAVAVLGALTAAACAGFLRHNWAPAKVFMGDAGAAFLGFAFATLPFLLPNADGSTAIAAAALVGLFGFDTTITLVRRALRRERVWEAHRSHFYQRLVATGRTHAAVASLYAGIAVLLALVAVLTATAQLTAEVAAIAIVIAGVTVTVIVHHGERSNTVRVTGDSIRDTVHARH